MVGGAVSGLIDGPGFYKKAPDTYTIIKLPLY